LQLQHSVLLPYAVHEMFELIEQAEHYPLFVPWCTAAEVLERSEDWVAARLEFSYHTLHFSLHTRNAKRQPQWLRLGLVQGPFREFYGEWELLPLGALGCKVVFSLRFEVADGFFDGVVAPVVQRVSGAMVEAFVKRAAATLRPLPTPAA
jgi:ribosome-associated toxin RatA of RatAB toxin-antitoxin module